MTVLEKRNYKKRLQDACFAIIRQRIDNLRKSIASAQASANQEEKSSAGDKYETARAMSHIEKDMHAKQLASNMSELENLASVDCNTLYQSAEKGSIIDCESISFFIIAGLGKIMFEGKTIYLVSPYAPIFKTLKNKKAGESLLFNKRNYSIINVY